MQAIDVFPSPAWAAALKWTAPGATLGDALAWLQAHLRPVEARLAETGALLLRGLPVKTAEDFDAVVQAFGLAPFPYERALSNAVRVMRTPRVFTANESPPTFTIPLHHEMAQTPLAPRRLWFFCERPAERGGATPICRSDHLYERLSAEKPSFVERCARLGLRYTTVMPARDDAQSGLGRSWRSTFGVEAREDAEAKLRALGYGWQWLDDDCLRATTPQLPAVRALAGGRTVFFNQLIAATAGWRDTRNDPAKAVTFGDGSPLDLDGVQAATAIAGELAVDVPWCAGDVLVVDNDLVMHGRRSFEGRRSVLVALS